MRRRNDGWCAVLAGVLLAACAQPEDESSQWPAGTVLVVDGVSIEAAAVDALVDALLDIKPAYSLTQRRRLIVINWSFPMAYGQALAGPERDKARLLGQMWITAQESDVGVIPAPDEGLLEGNWDGVGVAIWLAARELEPGQSSGLVELPGRFVQIEMIERDGRQNRALEQFVLRVKAFDYVDNPRALVSDCMQASLEIVAPPWREIVPGLYKYKMEGGLE